MHPWLKLFPMMRQQRFEFCLWGKNSCPKSVFQWMVNWWFLGLGFISRGTLSNNPETFFHFGGSNRNPNGPTQSTNQSPGMVSFKFEICERSRFRKWEKGTITTQPTKPSSCRFFVFSASLESCCLLKRTTRWQFDIGVGAFDASNFFPVEAIKCFLKFNENSAILQVGKCPGREYLGFKKSTFLGS